MNFQWWFGTYSWLEQNNLWKAAVAFFVTVFLGAFLSLLLRPWQRWRRHVEQREHDRQLQEKIADHLDTGTPGGLTDLVSALRELLDDLDGGDAPDDNGSDQPVRRKFSRGHGEPESRGTRGIPGSHGGGGATHGR